MVNGRKTPEGTLEQRPLWTPLALFLGAQGFLCGKLLTWRIRQVGSKKSPRVRGGFFSVLGVGGLWDGFTVFRVCAALSLILFIVLY